MKDEITQIKKPSGIPTAPHASKANQTARKFSAAGLPLFSIGNDIDGADMHEDILTAIVFDESVALRVKRLLTTTVAAPSVAGNTNR
jgi:hypothetical protein